MIVAFLRESAMEAMTWRRRATVERAAAANTSESSTAWILARLDARACLKAVALRRGVVACRIDAGSRSPNVVQ